MSEQELFYTLALHKAEGIGDITSKKLVSAFGSAEAVFTAGKQRLSKVSGIGPSIAASLANKTLFHAAEHELKFIIESGIQPVSFRCEDYPEKLKYCNDGPLLLFQKGKIGLHKRKVISIVGTRKVTQHGAAFCRKLIADLAPLDPVIVSGFAYGVDIVAHQTAFENGLETIAVVAHGLNQIYPKMHKRFVTQVESNGGFMTEFWSTSDPDRENFIKRNRIVAGLSEATIVIESAEKGGSLITANMAYGYNRDVFAVPGRAEDLYSKGCNNLIKTQKANLLTAAADLIYVLNWDLSLPVKTVQKQLFVELEAEEQVIFDYLSDSGRQFLDTIALDCGLPIFRIASTLLNMEMKGVVRPLPGKQFEVA